MSASFRFLSLPAELRNEIYKYLLVYRQPIDPWYRCHGLEPNILCTNTKILHEARSILYAENCFELRASKSERIPEFLDTIGPINASHIQCVRIDFPTPREHEDTVSLEEDSLCILEKVQHHCSNLKKVITTPETINLMEN
ncbi:uncharacterized protein N7479_005599 [Penicillium vulpinum]|uniref:uncharacterized protein n=1 Tax=Penicillium vulpinum TaxID=29845 RepID=UPI002546A913|nr:uncharacterized protein N7479_005599 [Penicillium vulpinum]KAJ5958449.1 hypothetical protein N7479_005599 [Penicillium vulpinum]